MAIVTLKCKNCGQAIDVDANAGRAICPSCGTQNLIIPDNITNNYHQTINKTITATKDNAEEFLARANTFMTLGEKDKAIKAFQRVTDIEPANYLGWLGVAAAMTDNFSFPQMTALFPNPNDGYLEYARKALKVAPNARHDEIQALCERIELEITRYKRLVAEESDAEKFENREIIRQGDFGFRDLVLVEYDGEDETVSIPATYSANLYQPRSIGDDVFGGKTKIRAIEIPPTVTYIGNRAFNMCIGISSFTVPAGVMYMGKNVFAGWTKKQKIYVTRAQVKSFKRHLKKLGGKWNGNTKAKVIVKRLGTG